MVTNKHEWEVTGCLSFFMVVGYRPILGRTGMVISGAYRFDAIGAILLVQLINSQKKKQFSLLLFFSEIACRWNVHNLYANLMTL